MTSSPASIPIGPVSRPERIEVLDVLRGMALFGIIASNIEALFRGISEYAAGLSHFQVARTKLGDQ